MAVTEWECIAMAEGERVTVSFPEPLATQIRSAVQAGEYASMSDAVQDAVRLWSDRRVRGERDVADLRRAWDAGKAAGTHGKLDFEDLRREARDRLAATHAQGFRTSDAG
ncbi:type II toxin-antitoxin system ParD family antitoxin [Methylobacterium sp. Leaf469]|uniref:ribbon-helix-helix domain-containing protein n=1 Tax=Methylobacterium sp. Leaf469 TaxID=1736387 RepID=UPI000A8A3286|nr:type II toxin-antitoxin system ParD family antitoxin [Methylobacterium sp. Leaf469]